MQNIKADSTLVGATQLRTVWPKIKGDLKNTTVVVMDRGLAVAVLEDFDDFQEKTELLDTFEDLILGYLAKERYEQEAVYLSHEEILNKFN